MKTTLSDNMWDIQRVKSVSVLGGGDFNRSAPIFKVRSGPTMILLEYDDRDRLSRDLHIDYEDMRYQGRFDGALPRAWKVRNGEFRVHSQGWHNAESQWYDAEKLADYFTMKLMNEEVKEDLSLGAILIISMVDMAAGREQRVLK